MNHSRRGLSLLEMAIVVAVTGFLVAATFSVVLAMTRGDESLKTRVELQLEATQILRKITTLLKAAGPQENLLPNTTPPTGDGLFQPGEYPAFTSYSAQNPGAGKWADAWNAVSYTFINTSGPSHVTLGSINPLITPQAPLSDVDLYPPNPQNPVAPVSSNIVEVAFRVPKSLTPQIKQQPVDFASGAVEWGTEVFALVLVPGPNINPDGSIPPGYLGNELQLREYTVANPPTFNRKRVLSRNVERILFEAKGDPVAKTAASFYHTGNYDRSLAMNEIRVTVWLLKPDINGRPVKVSQSATFNFRSLETNPVTSNSP